MLLLLLFPRGWKDRRSGISASEKSRTRRNFKFAFFLQLASRFPFVRTESYRKVFFFSPLKIGPYREPDVKIWRKKCVHSMEEKRYNFARAREKKSSLLSKLHFSRAVSEQECWAQKKMKELAKKIFSSRVSLRETDAGLKFESIVRNPIRHSWGCQVLAGFLPSREV